MLSSKTILYGGDYDRKFEYQSMGDFIIQSLERNGDRKVLVNAVTGLTWTSREFLDQVIKYSSVLYGFGVRRNSIIGIVSENRHEVAALMFASLCLNAIVAPINFTYTKRELKHSLDLSKPQLIFVSSAVLDNIQEIKNELPYVEKVITLDRMPSTDKNLIDLEELVAEYEDQAFDLEKYYLDVCIAGCERFNKLNVVSLVSSPNEIRLSTSIFVYCLTLAFDRFTDHIHGYKTIKKKRKQTN